jgi:23S rRNA pseudouridine2605 synthase
MRISKYLADMGYCSRRQAEKLIKEGLISVNAQVLKSPAFLVQETDVVKVKDWIVKRKEKVTNVYAFYKPKGYVTSTEDTKGRPTVFDILPKGIERVVKIGRLDYNTEGLLLFTNDGDYARKMELPSSGLKRKYIVKTFGKITQERLDKLKNGTYLDGIMYGSFVATILEQRNNICKIEVTIAEGKNREVRKVLGSFGLMVAKLKRVQYGPYKLERLAIGEFKKVGVLV